MKTSLRKTTVSAAARKAWRWIRHRQYLRRLPPGHLEPRSDRFWKLLDRQSVVTRLATGFRFTEGPVWRQRTSTLLFTDIPASRIHEYVPGRGAGIFRSPSGKANGLTIDHSGRLIACEHENRRVSRTENDGSIIGLASSYNGSRLNSPNDVVVARSRWVYFTDPPYGIKTEEQELPFQGVFRIVDGKALELVTDEMHRPNGLAFAPDESRLYVTDSAERFIRVYDLAPDGSLTRGRLFCDMNVEEKGVPDGLKVDADGHIFSTGPGGVWVLDPEGLHLGTIRTPERPSNCAWGGADGTTLFITAVTSLYCIETKTRGILPPAPTDPS